MKIYLRKRGQTSRWFVDLGRVAGQRKRVRKQFESRAAAKTFLSATKGERANHGGKAFELTQTERLEFLRARDQLRDLGGTLDQAIPFYLERRPRTTLTLADAIIECVAAKKASGRRPRYLRQLEYTLRSFRAGRGDRLVSSLEPREIETWLNGNGWATATRKGYLADLRTLFSWCIRRGVLLENPCERLERVLLEDKPPGILTVDQVRQLLGAALERDATLIPYLAIGLFCGVRPEEIRRLTWDHIDLNRGMIEVPGLTAKTRRRRLLSIPGNAALWLNLGGQMPPINVWRRLQKLRRAAQIPWPHDAMRHSFASYHLAAHENADKTAHELGHGSTAMFFGHYREMVTSAMAAQFWAITPASLQTPEEPSKIVRI